jgi:hypothetical protein
VTERIWFGSAVDETLDVEHDPLVMMGNEGFSHFSSRETLHWVLASGGRLGLCDNPAHAFDASEFARPTRISSTPRFFSALQSQFQVRFFCLFVLSIF